jgi:hypothetical protein
LGPAFSCESWRVGQGARGNLPENCSRQTMWNISPLGGQMLLSLLRTRHLKDSKQQHYYQRHLQYLVSS